MGLSNIAPGLTATIEANTRAKRRKNNERFAGTRALERVALDAQRDYGTMIQPLEDQIRDTAMGRDAGTQVAGIREQGAWANRAADVSEGAFARERQGLGLGAAGQSTVRRLGLRRALAQVDAQNRAGDSVEARQRQAQQWSAQQWGQNNADGVSLLTQIAQGENDRMNQYKGAKEQRRGSIIGAATGLAGAAIVLSDRRLKRDIVHVGHTPSGIKLYSYKYLWSEAQHIGVMSDEVRHIPGAVIRGMFDRVDYSKVA